MNTYHYFTKLTFLLSAISVIALVADHAEGSELNIDQQRTILSEASVLYEKGEANSKDRALSKESYAKAATKYQTLINNGTNSWQMQLNLGNAYLQSGRLGPAISSYQRAAMLTNNKAVHANLKYAKSLVETEIPKGKSTSAFEDIRGQFDAIPSRLLALVAVLSWTCFWIAISFSNSSWQRVTKTMGALAATLFLAALFNLNTRDTNSQQPTGIVTTNQGLLREGNGIAFHPLDATPLAEGLEVLVLEQRGDWMNVQLLDGKTGWLPDSQVDVI